MTPVKLLTIDKSKTPIAVERFDLNLPPDQLKDHILELLNSVGSGCSILAKYNDQLWNIVHTAPRGKSKTYYKQQINYHPLAHKLS